MYRIKADFKEALNHINYSIIHEGDVFVGHRAAFRHDKALCLRGMGNEKSKKIMIESIDMQPDEKVKLKWSKEMKDW